MVDDENPLLRGLADEVSVATEHGTVSPALAARSYRAIRDERSLAMPARELLWREAANGNQLARAVLALLSDDPFWTGDAE